MKPFIQTVDIEAAIAEMVRRIVEKFHPEKIILFGSRARGDHRPESDLDLLVIKETDEPPGQREAPLYLALAGMGLNVDKEIVVYTPHEVMEWRGASLHFVTTALREGKVLYERK